MSHVIGVRVDEMCADRYTRPKRRPIGLTDEFERIDRRVREAVPDPPVPAWHGRGAGDTAPRSTCRGNAETAAAGMVIAV